MARVRRVRPKKSKTLARTSPRLSDVQQRHVEVSEVDARDTLIIRIRDAKTGRIVRQYKSTTILRSPDETYKTVAEIASGAVDVNADSAALIERLLKSPENDVRVYVVAMAKRKMFRGVRLAQFIDKVEEATLHRLEPSNQDPDNPTPLSTLVKVREIFRKEGDNDLDFVKSLIIPKKGDPLSAIPPIVHDAGSVHIHEHHHGSDIPPARRELLRNIIESLSGKVGEDTQ